MPSSVHPSSQPEVKGAPHFIAGTLCCGRGTGWFHVPFSEAETVEFSGTGRKPRAVLWTGERRGKSRALCADFQRLCSTPRRAPSQRCGRLPSAGRTAQPGRCWELPDNCTPRQSPRRGWGGDWAPPSSCCSDSHPPDPALAEVLRWRACVLKCGLLVSRCCREKPGRAEGCPICQ